MSDKGEVIKTARAIIASGAWCKGATRDDQKRCALGAVWHAESLLQLQCSGAVTLLNDLAPISAYEADEVFGLQPAAAYNDLPSTQLEDVVALFDKALAELGGTIVIRDKVAPVAWLGLAAVMIGSSIGLAARAKADEVSGCKDDLWITWQSTRRALCDGVIHPDGSWWRAREFYTPAHQVPLRTYCSGGIYYSSCSTTGGYFQPRTSQGVETYIVTPETVLPDEPGHLVGGA